MANKTLKFYGIGYAPTGQTASITAMYDGATIFTGAIPTIASTEVTPDPTQYDVMFTHDIDANITATVPMSVTLTGGLGFTIARVEVNNPDDIADFRIMRTDEQGDCRTSVEINGVPQEKGPLADVLTGAWSWNILEAGIITYDLNILDPFASAENETPS
jgi:hypothetical protein